MDTSALDFIQNKDVWFIMRFLITCDFERERRFT